MSFSPFPINLYRCPLYQHSTLHWLSHNWHDCWNAVYCRNLFLHVCCYCQCIHITVMIFQCGSYWCVCFKMHLQLLVFFVIVLSTAYGIVYLNTFCGELLGRWHAHLLPEQLQTTVWRRPRYLFLVPNLWFVYYCQKKVPDVFCKRPLAKPCLT